MVIYSSLWFYMGNIAGSDPGMQKVRTFAGIIAARLLLPLFFQIDSLEICTIRCRNWCIFPSFSLLKQKSELRHSIYTPHGCQFNEKKIEMSNVSFPGNVTKSCRYLRNLDGELENEQIASLFRREAALHERFSSSGKRSRESQEKPPPSQILPQKSF